jgi:NADH-quinone oxidoreductase subunit A
VKAAGSVSWVALGEIVLFFGILLVGFAYLWKRGDLAWVRSLQAERQAPTEVAVPTAIPSPAAAIRTGEPAVH